jgi:pentatricopeptide repeat protein
LAEQLLHDMHNDYNRTQDPRLQPQRRVFNMVLKAWANHKTSLSASSTSSTLASQNTSRAAPQRAEAIVQTMWDLYETHQFRYTQPNVFTYTIVMTAWIKSGQADAAERTEALLRQLQTLSSSLPSSSSSVVASPSTCSSSQPPQQRQGTNGTDEGNNNKNNSTTTAYNSNKYLRPNAIAYHTVMSAYAKRGNVEKVRALLDEMSTDYWTNGNQAAKPTVSSWNILLYAYSKRGKQFNNNTNNNNTNVHHKDDNNTAAATAAPAAQQAEQVLAHMWDLYHSGYPTLETPPNDASYNCVISTWAHSSRADAPQMAVALLRDMQQRYTTNPIAYASVRPSVFSYTSVMDALAKKGHAEEAEALLEEMCHDYSVQGNESAMPTVVSYSAVLNAWSKSRRSNQALQRAEAILVRMWDLYDSKKLVQVKPTLVSYNCVIDSWAHSSQSNAAQQAEAVFRHLQDRYLHQGDVELKPNSFLYGTVMNAYAKKGQAEKVEALFQEMYHEYVYHGNDSCQPNTRCYTTVLDAWSKSSSPQAPYRAEAILAQMWQLHDESLQISTSASSNNNPTRILNVKPNSLSYNCVVHCWANQISSNSSSSSSNGDHPTNAPARAEAVFREMIDKWHQTQDPDLTPTPVSYGTVIHAYGKRGQAKKAEALLQEMLQDYFSTIATSTTTRTTTDKTTTSKEELERERSSNNNNSKISYSLQHHPTGATSRSIRTDFDDQVGVSYNNNNDPTTTELQPLPSLSLPPQPHYYPSSSSSASLLKLPTVISFNTVLNAWSKSNLSEAPLRSEAILRQMWDLYDHGHLDRPPDNKSYTSVIRCQLLRRDDNDDDDDHTTATTRNDGPEQADRLLQEMKSRQCQQSDGPGGNGRNRTTTTTTVDLAPDFITYTSVMTVWSKRGTNQGIQRIKELLYEMLSLAATPSRSGGVMVPNPTNKQNSSNNNKNHHKGNDDDDEEEEAMAAATTTTTATNTSAVAAASVPSVVTFNVVLGAICSNKESTDAEKKRDTLEILKLMQQYGVTANKSTRNTVKRLSNSSRSRRSTSSTTIIGIGQGKQKSQR